MLEKHDARILISNLPEEISLKELFQLITDLEKIQREKGKLNILNKQPKLYFSVNGKYKRVEFPNLSRLNYVVSLYKEHTLLSNTKLVPYEMGFRNCYAWLYKFITRIENNNFDNSWLKNTTTNFSGEDDGNVTPHPYLRIGKRTPNALLKELND